MESKKEQKKHEEHLLQFLQKTREGKYAKIDESSLAYVRIREKSELIEPAEETFYYSVS